MLFDFFGALPISQQLVLRLRGEILSGVYAPGSSFPTVRQIACDCAVNPNTVQRALSQLESEGLLLTNSTVGRIVNPDETVLETARENVKNAFLTSMQEQTERLAISPEAVIAYYENLLQSKNQERKESV